MLGAAVDDVWTEADARTALDEQAIPGAGDGDGEGAGPGEGSGNGSGEGSEVTTSAGRADRQVDPGCVATIGGSTPPSVRCTTEANREPGERTAPVG